MNRVHARTHGLIGTCVLAGSLLAAIAGLHGQSAGVQYIYDELGRLVGVLDPAGEAAIYTYDAVGNLLSISRESSSSVSVIEFTPDSGPVGTSVTVYGTGFSSTASENTLTFNGTGATITSATSTTLVADVPPAATTGPIGVTTPSGTAQSAQHFIVTAGGGGPTITGFSPTIGVAGTAVTIEGANFDSDLANNRVLVNQSFAALTSASPTSIIITVPVETGSGPITVATPLGSAVTPQGFFFVVPPPPYGPADVEWTGYAGFEEPTGVAITTSGKIGLLVFDGEAGRRSSVKVQPGSSGTIALLKPDNSTLESIGVGVLTALIEPQVLPTTGAYTVLVDPTGSGTGTTTVTVYDVPPDFSGSIVAGGPSETVTLTTPGQNGALTFAGSVNQRVSLWIGSGLASTVSILDPNATALASLTKSSSLSAFIDTTVLPTNGTQTVFVNATGASTGSVTLALYDVPPDVTGTITPGGSSVPVTISTPGQNSSLTFEGSAGQRVSLKISSGLAGTFKILNPDGSTLASLTKSSSLTSFLDTVSLAAAGTHTVLVDGSGADTGTVTLTLYDVPPDVTGTLTIGGPAAGVTITTPGQNASLALDGSQGQQATVHVTNSNMSTVTVKLLKPDGTALTSKTSSLGSFDLQTQTLPVNGTYTVLVDPSKWNTGSLNLSVTSP